jgi:hypothetical protein
MTCDIAPCSCRVLFTLYTPEYLAYCPDRNLFYLLLIDSLGFCVDCSSCHSDSCFVLVFYCVLLFVSLCLLQRILCLQCDMYLRACIILNEPEVAVLFPGATTFSEK